MFLSLYNYNYYYYCDYVQVAGHYNSILALKQSEVAIRDSAIVLYENSQ